MNVSIGLFAHNEKNNISASVRSILNQRLDSNWRIKELIVVVSGSTDGTDKIAVKLAEKHKEIKLIIEKKRLGKVAAVNKFIRTSKSNYLVLTNADNVFSKTSFQHLLDGLKQKDVGLVGGRVIPKNNLDSFFNYSSHLQWYLLHKMNIEFPDHVKCGELIAFRRVFKRISRAIPFDEASIEGLIRAQGFGVKYVPKAVVYNWGPDNWHDYITLRKRNNAGHYVIKSTQGYSVLTLDKMRILGIFVANWDYMKPHWQWAIGAVALEVLARVWAWVEVNIQKRSVSQWQRISSAKKNFNLLGS